MSVAQNNLAHNEEPNASKSLNPVTQAFGFDTQNPHYKSGQAAVRHYMDGQPPISLDYIQRAHWRAGYRAASGGFA